MSETLIRGGDNQDGQDTGLSLWMENGCSREDITQRMLAAAPDLRIFSSTIEPYSNTTVVEHPSLLDGASIEEFNKFVDRHGIDIVWPQYSAVLDLSGIEAEVHVPAAPEVVRMIDDKARFAEWLGDDPLRAYTVEVTGASEVAREYERQNREGRDVCVKPAIGVFGTGYWHLMERPNIHLINDPGPRELHPDLYISALEKLEAEFGPQRTLVMEYLPGPEVSADVLCWRGVPLIHAARTKLDGVDAQRIQSEHPTLDHARDVAARLAMHGIVSMQYRLDSQGEWKMLEVNPRPAGGSINSEDAGFGIISGWTNLVARKAGPDEIVQHNDDVLLSFKRVAFPQRMA